MNFDPKHRRFSFYANVHESSGLHDWDAFQVEKIAMKFHLWIAENRDVVPLFEPKGDGSRVAGFKARGCNYKCKDGTARLKQLTCHMWCNHSVTTRTLFSRKCVKTVAAGLPTSSLQASREHRGSYGLLKAAGAGAASSTAPRVAWVGNKNFHLDPNWPRESFFILQSRSNRRPHEKLTASNRLHV